MRHETRQEIGTVRMSAGVDGPKDVGATGDEELGRRPISARRPAANRRNARKSTGPRVPAELDWGPERALALWQLERLWASQASAAWAADLTRGGRGKHRALWFEDLTGHTEAEIRLNARVLRLLRNRPQPSTAKATAEAVFSRAERADTDGAANAPAAMVERSEPTAPGGCSERRWPQRVAGGGGGRTSNGCRDGNDVGRRRVARTSGTRTLDGRFGRGSPADMS